MKIGIDAKWYFKGPASGRIVVRNIVHSLAEISKKHEIVLFIDKNFKGRKLDIPEHNFKIKYVWAGNNALSNLFILPYYANQEKLDVVLFQTFTPFWGKSLKITYIHDILYITHPQFYTRTERLYLYPVYFLSKCANALVTVSETEKDRMSGYGFERDKVKVIYHGVDKSFQPRENFAVDPTEILGRPLPEKFILYVGRLNVRKNLFHLIKALTHLKDKNIKLVIVGDVDWKMFNLKEYIQKLNIEDRIIQLGHLDGQYLSAAYSLGTVFCFPSFAESFGMPTIEAMASGIPSVVSDIPVLREICGEGAVYIDPENEKDIAEKIDKLLMDEKSQLDLKLKGLERAKYFTWEKTGNEIIKTMEEIVENSNAKELTSIL